MDALWLEALNRAREARRIMVLGPTDAGKSTFIRAFAAETGAAVVDLDPGQKMIGPPGTASLGRLAPERLERMIFLGTTSASAVGAIARAGAALAGEAQQPLIVNTSGFVRGLGARLQALTAAAILPDLIVEIGTGQAEPPIAPASGVQLLRLARSPAARRKSPAARTALRQAAFEYALAGAAPFELCDVGVHPAPPAFAAGAFPVCSLADADGTDLAIGICTSVSDGCVRVEAALPDRPVATVRLGKMWAQQDGAGGWRLLEKLWPAWEA